MINLKNMCLKILKIQGTCIYEKCAEATRWGLQVMKFEKLG